jgi:hypothetical protein
MQSLSLHEEPLIKGRAIGERKAIQKRPTDERYPLGQSGSAFGAIFSLPGMRVRTASFNQVLKEGYIQFVRTEGIEL